MSNQEVKECVLAAVRDFNELREDGNKVPETLDDVLFGPGGSIDSLGLVNLIVHVEEACEDALGQPVTIASEKAMSQKHSPFRSLQALIDFVSEMTQSES